MNLTYITWYPCHKMVPVKEGNYLLAKENEVIVCIWTGFEWRDRMYDLHTGIHWAELPTPLEVNGVKFDTATPTVANPRNPDEIPF